MQVSSAQCITVSDQHIYSGCADGVVRVFSASSLHYITSLPKPHYLGVDVTAGRDARYGWHIIPSNPVYKSNPIIRRTLKALLHYALGLRFGNVCDQNATKTRPKRDQNATDSRFYPTHSVIKKHCLALGSRF